MSLSRQEGVVPMSDMNWSLLLKQSIACVHILFYNLLMPKQKNSLPVPFERKEQIRLVSEIKLSFILKAENCAQNLFYCLPNAYTKRLDFSCGTSTLHKLRCINDFIILWLTSNFLSHMAKCSVGLW